MTAFFGRTVLLNGAGGGIGTAMVQAFAHEGASLALVDIADGTSLVDLLQGNHRCWQLDLANPDAISESVAEIGTEIGPEMGIDILINNAGLGMVDLAEKQSVNDWDMTKAINLRAPWFMAWAALPWLKAFGKGRVVNIASKAGIVAIPEHAAYGAS